ncbi:hypothetical protein SEA_SEPHIROTH_130 [Gordonia Phage Sephiroth]|uniref:Uncharacterized protein n=1 Tax=Gordonia Phage Sephiroth TaxID=2767553 RepID=A0A7G9UZK9_9CAUD|nr:hypothetical protein L3Y23_gp101 [Gordonia Phage Sephiroth]QNN99464.1 hypothetical protein SEA_SEPHIROTH_130 [Gordonia Phage Sephiroth]
MIETTGMPTANQPAETPHVAFTPWHETLKVEPRGGGYRITAADGRYWDVEGDVITADRGNRVPVDCKLGAALLWAVNTK